jgi:hypothetical protein
MTKKKTKAESTALMPSPRYSRPMIEPPRLAPAVTPKPGGTGNPPAEPGRVGFAKAAACTPVS